MAAWYEDSLFIVCVLWQIIVAEIELRGTMAHVYRDGRWLIERLQHHIGILRKAMVLVVQPFVISQESELIYIRVLFHSVKNLCLRVNAEENNSRVCHISVDYDRLCASAGTGLSKRHIV